ncbi:MAG: hypothetical protein CVT84_12935 [Alphaproteobacteria bacterium HGW-Alphaproteobacteria-6]|nr:MAG: hypothetical protein CVT84_12935 [Alphaproteobacteria bacterium HGW-Alphaproteobacteria-6]
MRISLMKKLRSFRSNDEGVTLVEYGIALVLAVTVGTSTLLLLAGDVTGQMDAACDAINATTATGC